MLAFLNARPQFKKQTISSSLRKIYPFINVYKRSYSIIKRLRSMRPVIVAETR